MKRIGIFGGTFNPIHTAHLIIAENVREQLELDKVLFIPSAIPPHKNGGNLADAEIRLNLINLAIKGNKHFESSDIEIRISGHSKSYTFDTLRKLKEMYGDVKLFLLIGMDCLIELHTWREPEKLFEDSEVVVINRAGYSVRDANNEYADNVKYVTVPDLQISSTEIRKKVKEGKSIRYLVPESVEEYIIEKGLYV